MISLNISTVCPNTLSLFACNPADHNQLRQALSIQLPQANPCHGGDLNYGDIGAFIVGNETYIKEYQEDGLHSVNPDYPTMHFSDEESVYLIGRVLGIPDKADYASADETERYLAVHGE